MKKFINDRFFDDIDGSSCQYLHRRLILNMLKYLWEHVETETENYTVFNDKKEGEYKKWFKDKNGHLHIQCAYLNNKLEGGCSKWYRNGQLWVQCTHKNGKEEGEYKRWHDNGQLLERYICVNDKIEGEYKRWHSNGQLWEQRTYTNGKREGEYKMWCGSGQLSEHHFYTNGIATLSFTC